MIKNNTNKLQGVLRSGGVCVIATDTLYGLVGSALDRAVVERIYCIKRRQPSKPFIILIGSLADLKLFGITPDDHLASELNSHWPGPVSIILSCPRPDLEYLHRGTNTLAFRLPAKPTLRHLLTRTGPLVAPSANPEGEPPASTIAQARDYFGSEVDFYKAGRTKLKSSKLIRIKGGQLTVIRP